MTVIDIDGSILEGGGQILRIATALSVVLRKPIRVRNIRAGRSSPGLRPQHLTGLQLMQRISQGNLEGGKIGSTEITFTPGHIQSGNYIANTGTAGSVVLLLQVALPCLVYANEPSQLRLTGGTNAEMAPQIDYTTTVFLPTLEPFGVKFTCQIHKRGYFPKGGGDVGVSVTPVAECLSPICLKDPGAVQTFKGRAFVAGTLPIKISYAMTESASQLIKKDFPGIPLNIDSVKESPDTAVGNGTGIVLVSETSTNCRFGASGLGKRGVQAQEVGYAAAKELIEDLKYSVCVDRHMQDQLIIFMALAKGKSQVLSGPLTLHTKTAIHVTELMTQVKFLTLPQDGDRVLIECEGLGMKKTQ